MNPDDINGEDPKRDERGRFLKGECGNPNGRPRKPLLYDETDPLVFANTLVQATVNGQPRLYTRRLLNKEKMFQSAMGGSVRAQLEFEKQCKETDKERDAQEA